MSDPSRARSRRRLPWTLVALPLLVVASAIPSAFHADERFKVYMHAAQYRGNLFTVVAQVWKELPTFFDLGNVRPLARIVDRFQHSVAFEISMVTGLPPHLGHALFRIIALVTLSASAWWLVRIFERPPAAAPDQGPGAAGTLVPVTLAGSYLALTTQSPIVLFPFLYMMSGAAVLAVTGFLLRSRNQNDDPISPAALAGYALLGAALALFNEITYLAVPIAFIALVVWRWVHRPGVAPTRFRAARAWLSTTVGFLLVFVPVRVAIALRCAETSCYRGSDIALTPEAPRLWMDRVVDSFFGFGWARVVHTVRGKPGVPDIGVFIANWGGAIIAVSLIAGAFVVSRRLASLPAMPAAARLPLGLGALGLGINVVAGALAATSLALQQAEPRLASPWRESTLSMVGWALILVAALLPLRRLRVFRGRIGLILVTVGLSGFLLGSSYANIAASARLRADPESVLHDQISAAMVSFGLTDEAAATRCRLVEDLGDVYASKGSDVAQTLRWINRAAIVAHGRPFCEP